MSGWSGGGGRFGGGAVAWDPSVTGIACAQLRDARGRAEAALHALRAAPDLVVAPAPGVDAAGLRWCGAELDARAAATQALLGELDRLHDHAMLAGRAYEWASDAVRDLIESVAGSVAYALGTAVRTAAFAAAPWAVAIGLVAVPLAAKLLLMNPQLLGRVTAQAQAAGTDLGRFLQDTSAFWEQAGETLMANPAFAGALALAIESSDEAMAGLLGIPVWAASNFEARFGDDEITGLMSLSAASGLGLINGGSVQAVFSRPVAVPDEPVAEVAEAMRVIAGQDEQVTIYQFAMDDGSIRYQVFVRGTEIGEDSGLDMRANFENAGSLDNAPGLGGLHGSDAAVAEAMREAGIEPGDAVDVFGHSQGAAAVANVAASGEFNIETATLVGGPVAATEIPPDVHVLAIAHEGDWVSALDGWADGEGVTTTVVESAGGHGTGPMARHEIDEYIDTAEHNDGFMQQGHERHLAAVTAGGTGVSGVSVHLRRR